MSPPLSSPGAADTSRQVWLVLGDKLGDNAQVEVIAAALGWPCEVRRLVFREPYVQGKPEFAAGLEHLDLERSDPLQPPWPDLVVTIGRRPAMVALWIQGQSGGRTRLVLLGRPKRWLERFDLVVATAQYRVPPGRNVLNLGLPLMRSDTTAIAAAAAAWRARLEALPRPLIAVLVGGPTKPYVLDAQVAEELLCLVGQEAERAGGTLYITTSRRTPPAVAATLAAKLPPGARLYRWGQDEGDGNPYRALLGLADRFVVTGDSVTMMVEVARLGRPLAIFPLPGELHFVKRVKQRLARSLHRPESDACGGCRAWVAQILYRLGVLRFFRDLEAVHELLLSQGLAVRLGEPFRHPLGQAPDELEVVVARIQALFP